MFRIRILILLLASLVAYSANAAEFRTSLERFLENYTSLVKGKRVGLVTNQTGVDRRLNSVIDIFAADSRIKLVALFAPEHGIRGEIDDGKVVNDQLDTASGVPIYSLYGGKDHRPTPAQLKKIDVMIYYIQDVGCRSYTYIWHLLECMSACAEAGIPVIVLDVPNIWGLSVTDGPILDMKYRSFIGLYPVPYIYGLTVGELARYLNKTQAINSKLYIIPMTGLRRNQSMLELPIAWVPSSPQVSSLAAAYGYGVVGPIGTLGIFNIGVNTPLPFQIVAAPGLDAKSMSDYLNNQGLEGIRFRQITLISNAPPYAGKRISGVQLHFTNPAKVHPTAATIQILCYLRDNYPNFDIKNSSKLSNEGFDKAMGGPSLRRDILSGKSAATIIKSYQKELEKFRAESAPFLIYK